MMNKRAVIFGVKGTTLTEEEKDFFKQVNPLGFIFFKRNIESKEGIKNLISDIKNLLKREDILFLIDQEGGRVQRIREPLTINYKSACEIGKVYEKDNQKGLKFAYLTGLTIGSELAELGFNVNCAPVLDIFYEKTSEVIGDRAFSNTPNTVAILAKEYAKGMIDAGITPIVKHIPGHGRSLKDTHKDISVVDAKITDMIETDFIPFKNFDLPCFAMMSHIIYSEIDNKNPATLSKKIRKFIKEELGFSGLIMSDDFSMQALTNFESSFEVLAEKSLKTGVDIVLHCNGNMEEMVKIAPNIKNLCNNRKKIIKNTLALSVSVDYSKCKLEYEEFLKCI
ncbi:MAG: Beta-hexosaminidase [Alphaproteobacteria bacterium ADurb.Bin438]|nr:MAG: Beta-hexosaminidase [Alphaproteobacteria bacterium ADurb.Bin438]